MTSKTSCCNAPIFGKTVKRYWPLWVCYLLILLVLLPLSLQTRLQIEDLQYFNPGSYICSMLRGGSALLFVVSAFSAMGVFSYLYNEKSCGFFAALPGRRGGKFLATALAGFVPLVAVQLITALVLLGVEAGAGCVALAPIATWFGVSVLQTVAYYGFAVLCAQLTGVTLVVPAVFVVLNFCFPLLELLCRGIVALFCYGTSMELNLFTRVLCPPAMLIENTTSFVDELGVWQFSGWSVAAIYAGVSLIFGFLAYLLYRSRRMETAGDFVAVKVLKPIFKFALATGCALGFSMVLYLFSGDNGTFFGLAPLPGTLLTMLLGGFIGYFGAEMLMKKTFRVFDTWKGFAVFFLVAAALVCCLNFDIFGIASYVPKAEEVREAKIETWGQPCPTQDTDNIEWVTRIHQAATKTKPYSVDLMGAALVPADDCQSVYFDISYELQNGSRVRRSYNIWLTEETRPLIAEIEQFMNTPEARQGRLLKNYDDPDGIWNVNIDLWLPGDGEGVTQKELSGTAAREFYENCIVPDVMAGNMNTVFILDDSPFAKEHYGGNVTIEYYVPAPTSGNQANYNGYQYLYFEVTKQSENTVAWLQSQGIVPVLDTQPAD